MRQAFHLRFDGSSSPALRLHSSAPRSAGMQNTPLCVLTRTLAPLLVFAIYALGAIYLDRVFNRRQLQSDPWVAAQLWARQNTPRDALFLTPSKPGGFRIHSERSVVGEWRDGTQLYFTGSFAPVWWDRITALQPGLALSGDGQRLLTAGKSLADLDDRQIVALCARYGATHVVLPSAKPRMLVQAYANNSWA